METPGASLRVRVTCEDERLPTGHLTVQVLSAVGVIAAQATTDSGGFVEFGSIRPGTYQLRVTGVNIEETTTESFSLLGRDNLFLPVTVKLRQAGEQGAAATDPNVPNKARGEHRKGQEELRAEEWKKAIEHFEKAIAIYPQYAAAYNNLGVAWIKLNDLARARQAFEKAIRLDERFALAYRNLSRVAFTEQDWKEMEVLLAKFLALEPRNAEALTQLADFQLVSGRYDEAIANARKVHSIAHQDFAVAHLIAARALEAQNRRDEAIAEYETLLKEKPDHPRAQQARDALTRLQSQRP